MHDKEHKSKERIGTNSPGIVVARLIFFFLAPSLADFGMRTAHPLLGCHMSHVVESSTCVGKNLLENIKNGLQPYSQCQP